MRLAIEGATWTTLAPVAVHKGPIPTGALGFPAIGLMTDAGDEVPSGRGYHDTVETFSWTLAIPLSLDGVDQTYLGLLAWRDEARGLATAAAGGLWGLAAVHRSEFKSWEGPDLSEVPMGDALRLLWTVILKMEVRYREQA